MNVRACRRCLNYEGMRRLLSRSVIPLPLQWNFSIASDGICSICHAYDDAFDAIEIAKERDAAIEAARKQGVVVAMSGGKDALSTLFVARMQLGLDVTAVMLDNRWLVDGVVAQSKRVCEQLDVPLKIVRPTKSMQTRFDRQVNASTVDESHPCEDCGALISDALLKTVDDVNAGAVFAGSNYFVAWMDRVRATTTTKTPKGRDVLFGHLPFALALKRDDVIENVKKLGAEIVDAPGVSSNCRVPSIVHARVGEKLGHIPELEDLSLEVMVGHRTRADALDELVRKDPQCANQLLKVLTEF